MAIPKIAAKAAGSVLASEEGDNGGGIGGIMDKIPNPANDAFSNVRASGMGVFSDKRLKMGLTIGRYAQKGKDSKGRETVGLGTFGSDMKPPRAKPKEEGK